MSEPTKLSVTPQKRSGVGGGVVCVGDGHPPGLSHRVGEEGGRHVAGDGRRLDDFVWG